MSQKVLLAEGLNLLQRTKVMEHEVDCKQQQVSTNNTLRCELSNLYSAYERVGNNYLLSAEIVNHVRRSVMEDQSDLNNRRLITFCEEKMKECMDRCEAARVKKNNILLPLDQMGRYPPKEGFELGEPVLLVNGKNFTVKRSCPFARTVMLQDGSYVFWVKNLDCYSIAAPKVGVLLEFSSPLGTTKSVQKLLPSQCGWKYVIGVVQRITVRVVVDSDGVMRDSHVEIGLYSLIENQKGVPERNLGETSPLPSSNGFANDSALLDDGMADLRQQSVPNCALPAQQKQHGISANDEKDITEELLSLKVPHVASKEQPTSTSLNCVQINSSKRTCAQRLQQLQKQFEKWPQSGVTAVPLERKQQRILESLYALPIPVEINDDDEE